MQMKGIPGEGLIHYINTSGVVHAHSTKCRCLTTTHRKNANEPRPSYHCL